MGVLCHNVVDKTAESPNPPFPSAHMALLFHEFLGRYKEWKLARRQEKIGMIIALLLGLLALILPWIFKNMGVAVSFVMLILFYFSIRHYFELSERVSHLYVNVHILYHHLVGKLEVGFCDHREPCQCAESFRTYVLQNHGISFDSGTVQ